MRIESMTWQPDRQPSHASRAWVAGLGVLTLAGTMLAAATAPVRLVGVSRQENAVLIEASAPVAYGVSQPDPFTVVVNLRHVSVGDARNDVQRGGALSGVRLEQASDVDGASVARVHLSLAQPAEYKVRSARNTIRVELSPSTAQTATTNPRSPAPKVEADPQAEAPEPMISLEEALRNGAAITPRDPTPREPITALQDAPITTVTPNAPVGVSRPVAATKSSATVKPSQRTARTATSAQQTPAPAPAKPPSTGQVISSEAQKKYTGHPISLDFQGADLRAVLRGFSEISGLNMVIDPDVQGTVDIILNDVPWDQGLEVILRGNQLDYTVDGTIVRIARVDTLKREQDARQALAKSSADAGTLSVRTFSLSYARAAAAAPLIKRAALSPRGDVQIDERTNTLIITDLPARLDTAANLLASLDRAEPQVEVEARIVQTTRDFARAVGIQWGLNGRVMPDVGNTTNLAFPNQGTLGGRLGTQSPTDPRASSLEQTATAVNLGVKDANSAIGLALGAINGAFNLDVALSALERTGKGRVLSTPRLTTQNNIEAEVAQGIQIPIQTVANNTVTVSFKEAVLKLTVTPQITAANTVIMKITIENAAADFSRQVNGIPPIDTQRANTQVQIDDGATTVIGGIFVSQEQTSNEKTPMLYRMPLLGWLFKRDRVEDSSRELLIFITPRILKG
jgi:type IV pilus assembly protein PilQ